MTAIDHLGIAVHKLADALPFWRDLLGMELVAIEEVASEKVRVAILRPKDDANGARIELLEPTAPDSPIAKHLEKRGPGLHHVAMKVDDIAARMAGLAAAGNPAMDSAPRVGAGGCMVTFLHPKQTGGVLLELSQPPAGGGGH
ncbi:MAG: methylmalonyl-CoA epimerase [Planctomycetes bacterium]|nr:methylmalonyl-CoA epimerase [Planctomycetota bacterium]